MYDRIHSELPATHIWHKIAPENQCGIFCIYDALLVDFVATNRTINISIPTQPDPVPVMSVFGWIIIQQRLGYTATHWQQPWAIYKGGGGSIDADFWLGLEEMHLLTSSQPYRLRVEVEQRSTNLWYSAEYWSFKIGDEVNDKYRLEVSGYSGDAGNGLQYEGGSISEEEEEEEDDDDDDDDHSVGNNNHNGMKFTTDDVDNDLDADNNCAATHGGGWWYNRCMASCLTCNEDNYEWLGVGRVVNSRMMIKPQ